MMRWSGSIASNFLSGYPGLSDVVFFFHQSGGGGNQKSNDSKPIHPSINDQVWSMKLADSGMVVSMDTGSLPRLSDVLYTDHQLAFFTSLSFSAAPAITEIDICISSGS